MDKAIEGPDGGAQRVSRIGYAVLACALALPIAASHAYGPRPLDAGRWFGQAIVAFLIGAIVMRLLLRGQSRLLHAYGRLLVGIGLLAWAITVTALGASEAYRSDRGFAGELIRTSVDPHRAQIETLSPAVPAVAEPVLAEATGSDLQAKEKDFVRSVIERSSRFQVQLAPLDRKREALRLSQAVTPEALTHPAQIIDGKQRLKQFSALVEERVQAVNRFTTDIEGYVRDAGKDDATRRRAFMSSRYPIDRAQRAFAELEAAQRAEVVDIGEMLDFAEANIGKMRLQEGRITFDSREQSDRYTVLAARIQASLAREEVAALTVQRLQTESQQLLVDRLTR